MAGTMLSCQTSSKRHNIFLTQVGLAISNWNTAGFQIRRGNKANSEIIFLISQPFRPDGSNEGPQCMFLWRNIKNYP